MQNESGGDAAHRLAVTWLEALSTVCYVLGSRDDVIAVLHGCVMELRDMLASPRFSTEPGTRCGERFVQSHLASAEVLERSLVLLDRELPPLVKAMPVTVDDLAQRWSRLGAAFAAGYVAAYVERVRRQKDDVYAAQLETLRGRGRRLVGRCSTDCAVTASDADRCGVAALASTLRMVGNGDVHTEAASSAGERPQEARW